MGRRWPWSSTACARYISAGLLHGKTETYVVRHSCVPLLLVEALGSRVCTGEGLDDLPGDCLVFAKSAFAKRLVKLVEVGKEFLGDSLLIYKYD